MTRGWWICALCDARSIEGGEEAWAEHYRAEHATRRESEGR